VTPPSLTIVIPAFNESARLHSTLPVLLAHVAARDAEIIVVDDGSDDDTALVADAILGTGSGQVLRLPENRGKGAAVRAGVAAARGEAVLFMDADLATDLEALPAVLKALEDADVVVGSRAVDGAIVYQGTWERALMGRAFNRMVRMLTRLEVHDTQCGFKAFRASVAKLLFAMSCVDGFAFDAEVLDYARILGFRISEVPVVWTAVRGSNVRPVRDSAVTAWALLRIVLWARPARVRALAAAHGWQPLVAHDGGLVPDGAKTNAATRRRRDESAE
jgi:arabinofuranan 3-O-arabinosyltransferase